MLTNPNPKKNWSVGDTCFYQETWSEMIVSGIITNISGGDAAINGGSEHPSCAARPLNTLFETREEAVAAANAESKAQIAAYEAEIADVAALVRFGYEHAVATCEEYTNWEAREAYRNRAKALLGLELE